jgi:hypothetical protein
MTPRFAQHWPQGALLALLAAVAFPLTWSPHLADLGGDSAIYVMTARHFAPYLPADPVARTFADASLFPPLYPLLLAATGGAADLRIAHAVTTACLLLAFAALPAALRALGLPRTLALAGTALFALMPETLARALQLRSEPLYLALSVAGFAWLARGSASARARDYWVASGLFGLALLTRTAGIALLPALLVALLRARPRHWGWMPIAMLLPALAWAAQRSEQTYATVVAKLLGAPVSSLLDLVAFNGTAFAWGLAGNLLQTQALVWVLLPLAAVALAVLARRFMRGEPDAWYLAAYAGMMLIWPYPEEAQRFAWVVVPWVLGYALWGLCPIADRLESAVVARAVRWLAPLAVGLLVLPSMVLAGQRWWSAEDRALVHLPEWYLPAAAEGPAKARVHLDLVRAVTELGAQVPASECVFSISPTVALLTGRLSYLVGEAALGDEAFEALVRRRGCRFFLLMSAYDGAIASTPFYPRERLGDRLVVLDVRYTGPADAPRPVAALAVLRGAEAVR